MVVRVAAVEAGQPDPTCPVALLVKEAIGSAVEPRASARESLPTPVAAALV
jgi:hypothetical protein